MWQHCFERLCECISKLCQKETLLSRAWLCEAVTLVD